MGAEQKAGQPQPEHKDSSQETVDVIFTTWDSEPDLALTKPKVTRRRKPSDKIKLKTYMAEGPAFPEEREALARRLGQSMSPEWAEKRIKWLLGGGQTPTPENPQEK